jgi:hypothetical protein
MVSNEFEGITPEDLGCMGEQEIDPGVKEENGFANVEKQPEKLCFKHIPEQNRKAYWKLYSQFENKDMSFEDFAIEMYAINSPHLMQMDLEKIIEQKHDGVARKQAIDRKIRKANMN